MDAEPMLLVHHGDAEILEDHTVLEQGVGADHDIDMAVGEVGQGGAALRDLVAPGEEAQAQRTDELRQALEMLARQDLGGRHQSRLPADLHRRGHGQQRHRRLARADIALEQAQHAPVGGEIGADLLDGPGPGRR